MTLGKGLGGIFIVILVSIGILCQTPEVSVKFQRNGKDIIVNSFQVSLVEEVTNKKIFDLESGGGRMKIPATGALPSSFQVRIVFEKYDLWFPGLNTNHLDNEWVIDVTDPIKQKKRSGNKKPKRKLIKQYSITFHPKNAEGTYQLFEIYDR